MVMCLRCRVDGHVLTLSCLEKLPRFRISWALKVISSASPIFHGHASLDFFDVFRGVIRVSKSIDSCTMSVCDSVYVSLTHTIKLQAMGLALFRTLFLKKIGVHRMKMIKVCLFNSIDQRKKGLALLQGLDVGCLAGTEIVGHEVTMGYKRENRINKRKVKK